MRTLACMAHKSYTNPCACGRTSSAALGCRRLATRPVGSRLRCRPCAMSPTACRKPVQRSHSPARNQHIHNMRWPHRLPEARPAVPQPCAHSPYSHYEAGRVQSGQQRPTRQWVASAALTAQQAHIGSDEQSAVQRWLLCRQPNPGRTLPLLNKDGSIQVALRRRPQQRPHRLPYNLSYR